MKILTMLDKEHTVAGPGFNRWLAGLLIVGFLCNWFVKAMHDRHYMPITLSQAPALASESGGLSELMASAQTLKLSAARTFVGIPLAWDVLETLQNALKLFR